MRRDGNGWLRRLAATGLVVALGLVAVTAGAQDQDRDRDQLRDPATHDASAPDQDRDRDRDATQLCDQIRQDLSLSDAEVAPLHDPVKGYLAAGGDREQLREMAREAHRAGCNGECLAESFRWTNQARERGASAEQVRAMHRETLRLGGGPGDGKPAPPMTAAQFRERFQERLGAWEKQQGAGGGDRERDQAREQDRARDQQGSGDRDRDQDRDRDRSQDRAQDRDQQRQQDRDRDRVHQTDPAGSGSGGGSGAGGGK